MNAAPDIGNLFKEAWAWADSHPWRFSIAAMSVMISFVGGIRAFFAGSAVSESRVRAIVREELRRPIR